MTDEPKILELDAPRSMESDSAEQEWPPIISNADTLILAQGVVAAYNAYQNAAAPVLNGFGNFQVIYVSEAGGPDGWVSQIFGFTATSTDGNTNVLCLRGTDSDEETFYDVDTWGPSSTTPCLLPSGDPQTSYGSVNQSFYDFYTSLGLNDSTLASSCLAAITASNGFANANARWLLAAHSLGGAILPMVVLDGLASNSFPAGVVPVVVTFGAVKLGLNDFQAKYNDTVPHTYRIANLCDFVPAFVGLAPTSYSWDQTYRHVGRAGTFIWQTWDDWGNHSMQNMYLNFVNNSRYWSLLEWNGRAYPQ